MNGIRSWWGWGWEQQAVPDAECVQLASALQLPSSAPLCVPAIADLSLSPPRITAPPVLGAIVSDQPGHRAGHTYGQAYRDVVRALRGDVRAAPDLVAFAQCEADVAAVLDWAGDHDVVVVPFGGGSSVVGGVEYRGDRAAVSLDLTRMNRVLEIDPLSRAARIEAGALGPVLEDQLRPHGYTLRHFPQSFEFSTLGGWLATRAGGHYATGPTHIDDFVESMRVVTPTGVTESWRLPGSGAGPSPDRLFLGSEGALGVITEAWMRIQDRPAYKAGAAVTFTDFADGLAAVRSPSRGCTPAIAGCLTLVRRRSRVPVMAPPRCSYSETSQRGPPQETRWPRWSAWPASTVEPHKRRRTPARCRPGGRPFCACPTYGTGWPG